jgi:hypothetical protein
MGVERDEPQTDVAPGRKTSEAQAPGAVVAPEPDLPAAIGALRTPPARGSEPVRSSALMRMQRAIGNRATGRMLAREWAVEPTVEHPAEPSLTARATASARWLDRVMFNDTAEIAVIRDVLGIPSTPSVVDEDFVTAVARYQASYGLTVDGILGPRTSGQLSQEITAERALIGTGPGTDTSALRRVARRLHLRSLTTRTQGTLVHQGFVGPDAFPDGAVTVRTGDNGNSISLEYTGENADSVNWLQFIAGDMSATPPGGAAPVLQTGTQPTSGGALAWSSAATTNWSVDTIPSTPPQPLYDVTSAHSRTAGRSIVMFDTPGGPSWLGVAQAFTAPGGTAAGATQVQLRLRFATYVVRANQARYRVDYTATTALNTSSATVGAIGYRVGGGRAVGGLAAEHQTALTAGYATSPIH